MNVNQNTNQKMALLLKRSHVLFEFDFNSNPFPLDFC